MTDYQHKKFFLKSILVAFTVLLPAFPAFADAQKADTEATAQSLTSYIQSEGSEKIPEANETQKNPEPEQKTWLNNLVNTVAESGSNVLNAKEQPIHVHRSNASVFDISGVMLRMNQAQAASALLKRGYRKMSEHTEIPNFIRWRYEELCRNQGVVGYEQLASCVQMMAKKNGYIYIQKESYANFHTKENIEIFYTSNFTGNKVHRVMYQTSAANIKGNDAKANYLRNIKIFDFWKKINQKYGAPDNPEQIMWGLGENKPSLQAATGRLILNDPMLIELDYTRMSREDQKFMNTAVYTF